MDHVPPLSLLLHAILTILLLSSNASPHLFSNETDRLALLHFKDQITHNPFHSLSSWNYTLHFCKWQGVTCGSRHPQRVVALALKSNNLVGTISTHIANLTFLRRIDLSNNSFQGAIPAEIGHLFRLRELLLSNNSLTGEIPLNLSNCSVLNILKLYGNKLVGSIPQALGSLSKLIRLALGQNNLTGTIPLSLGNLSSIRGISAFDNGLSGSIPAEFSRLTSLAVFAVYMNEISGTIPTSIYNLSSIQVLDVALNRLHGRLPPFLGLTLPNLTWFSVAMNQFTGPIPTSLPNATGLTLVQLDRNHFTGSVPNSLGSLPNLSKLTASFNQLGSGKVEDLLFLDSLTNCSYLTVLGIGGNNLGGAFSSSIANLSIRLQWLTIGENMISGSIPSGIGELVGLKMLELSGNMLAGPIPITIGRFNSLERLYLGGNKLSGEIPASLCNMTQLYELYLDANNLHGRIPSCLKNCKQLRFIRLPVNHLGGTLPKELFSFPTLSELLIQNNSFYGSLPLEVGHLRALQSLDVSNNNLLGEIPASLGDCLSLETLSLSGNFFQGSIPTTISALRGLRYLDLSRNNFSGKIPEYLVSFNLDLLDLSFNNFEGEVPKQGVFGNVSAISILANSKLCGGIQELHLPACVEKAKKKAKKFSAKKAKVIITIVALAIVVLSCFFIYLLWSKISRKKHSSLPPNLGDKFVDVSYAELLRATDGFSSINLIGMGSYGSVYKGVIHRIGTTVAVKVLNLLQEGAAKSFMDECEALRKIRHRNLIKTLTCCSSIDFEGNEFKALVFEYMPNGSLDKWLHKHGTDNNGSNLKLIQRLNIAIDVANALDYLHHHCEAPIVHRDLKPSNVLLDADMVAHISDFGLARFASAATCSTSNMVKGSTGYIAPEYAMGVKAWPEGDIYSYGILLLEMITGKEPTNEIFKENLTIHHFVKMALPDRVMEIADPRLLLEELEAGQYFNESSRFNIKEKMHDCLSSMARIAVICSAESANERMKMNEVIIQMKAIRNSYSCVKVPQERQALTKMLQEGPSYLQNY